MFIQFSQDGFTKDGEDRKLSSYEKLLASRVNHRDFILVFHDELKDAIDGYRDQRIPAQAQIPDQSFNNIDMQLNDLPDNSGLLNAEEDAVKGINKRRRTDGDGSGNSTGSPTTGTNTIHARDLTQLNL